MPQDYALCICAFHAAAALLVVYPELLRGKCNVSMIRNERPTPQARPTSRTELWAKAWYPSDIASFCSGLYSEAGPSPSGDEQQVDETREKYNIALVMLELFERDAEHMLLLVRGTQAERIASAGCDPDAFILKLGMRRNLFLMTPGARGLLLTRYSHNVFCSMHLMAGPTGHTTCVMQTVFPGHAFKCSHVVRVTVQAGFILLLYR